MDTIKELLPFVDGGLSVVILYIVSRLGTKLLDLMSAALTQLPAAIRQAAEDGAREALRDYENKSRSNTE